MDANNNVEAVRIKDPEAGLYTMETVASNVAKGPQTFALTYSGHF